MCLQVRWKDTPATQLYRCVSVGVCKCKTLATARLPFQTFIVLLHLNHDPQLCASAENLITGQSRVIGQLSRFLKSRKIYWQKI